MFDWLPSGRKRQSRARRDRRPNILFLFTDQQRFDTIAALGAPLIKTPVLDRLVREGVAFERCYTPSPVCVSARYALLTGLPPHATGCVDNKAVEPVHPAFMERLSEAGYRTHGVGKMHFMPDPLAMRGLQSRDLSEAYGDDAFRQSLNDRGYGHVDEPFGVRSEYYYIPQPSQLTAKAHHTHWVADRSIDFLRKRPKGRPFFLWAGFVKPHPPFEPPTPWNKLYRAAEMPKPFRPDGYEAQLSFWNRIQNRYKYKDAGTDDFLLKAVRAAYYASISFIDYNVGRILEALGDDIDETFVVFSSDHGEMLGDFGAFGKRCMLEASVRVPLIARFPGRKNAERRIDRPVSLMDLPATFLAVAGCDVEDRHAESADLSQLEENGRRYVYSQFSEKELGYYLVTDGRWKYAYCAADEKEWLYDLGSEAGEARNLIGEGPAQAEAERLRARLIERFRADVYENAVDAGGWRKYGRSEMPEDPDFGLLIQDPPGMQARVNTLGEYARPVMTEDMKKKRRILTGVRRPPQGD